MGIRVARFEASGVVRWGVVIGETLQEIQGRYESLGALLTEGTVAVESAAGVGEGEFLLSDVRLLSPVTRPARVVCQGVNYSSHRQEAGMQPQRPGFNLIFTKSDTSLSGPFDNVIRPEGVQLLDYEIEVGLVIRKAITDPIQITSANFTEYVAGLVIADDVSARDVQLVQGQWFKGKSYRTFCPTGPYVYLLDENEADVIHNLELRLTVNGEVRQSANTSQLLFKPEETLSELSQIVDFEPGDLVLTGTPGGVALNLSSDVMASMSNSSIGSSEKLALLMESQQGRCTYLKDGDVIVCEVKSPDGKVDLGTQRNQVVRAN